MQGSEEMYRFDIKEIDKEDALRMIRQCHYSNTLPKLNRHFLGFFLGDGLLIKPQEKPTLVPVSDKRQPMNVANVKDDFKMED